jgi:hypothetical protein
VTDKANKSNTGNKVPPQSQSQTRGTTDKNPNEDTRDGGTRGTGPGTGTEAPGTAATEGGTTGAGTPSGNTGDAASGTQQ